MPFESGRMGRAITQARRPFGARTRRRTATAVVEWSARSRRHGAHERRHANTHRGAATAEPRLRFDYAGGELFGASKKSGNGARREAWRACKPLDIAIAGGRSSLKRSSVAARSRRSERIVQGSWPWLGSGTVGPCTTDDCSVRSADAGVTCAEPLDAWSVWIRSPCSGQITCRTEK